jgi:hypothetical protein
MSEFRSVGTDTDTPPFTALAIEPDGSMAEERGASAAAITRLR